MRRAALVLVLALAVVAAPSAGAAGISFQYDITAGTPGDNNWFLSAVTVTISVQGATDSTCPATKTFRTSSDVLNCTATDGNVSAPFTLQFKIDTDAPTVSSASVDRAADSNGWYNHPVTITFVGSDATSGIASCTAVTYSGPDSSTATVGGVCKDKAGNTSSAAAFAVKYDSTPPTVTAAPVRGPDDNGWYSHAVQFTFAGSDSVSGIASCSPAVTYSGPDNASASAQGTCTDQAGNGASASSAFKYDSTGPKVTASLSRKPDSNGWYTKPVVAKFSGTDSMSGLASCVPAKTYKGPDGSAEKVTGTCRDNAGNTASGEVAIRYDGSGPKLAKLAAAIGDRSAMLSWKRPADVKTIEIVRKPGRGSAASSVLYRGHATSFRDTNLKVGVSYRYTFTSRDAAGNKAVASLTATPRALYAPAAGAHVRGRVTLSWVARAGARYYNVQLFRGKQKILSVWPVTASVSLPRTWTYGGKKVALAPGTYHWYVWPGRGSRSESRYGAMLGGSSFVVK